MCNVLYFVIVLHIAFIYMQMKHQILKFNVIHHTNYAKCNSLTIQGKGDILIPYVGILPFSCKIIIQFAGFISRVPLFVMQLWA